MDKEDEIQVKNHEKHIPRVRDVWTNRVIGWATGALIPILLLLIPLANRWMDDSKELEKLRITGSIEQIRDIKIRLSALEAELQECKRSCKG